MLKRFPTESGLTQVAFLVKEAHWDFPVARYLPKLRNRVWLCQDPDVNLDAYVDSRQVTTDEYQAAQNPEFIAVAIPESEVQGFIDRGRAWLLASALARWDSDGCLIRVSLRPDDAQHIEIEGTVEDSPRKARPEEPFIEELKVQIFKNSRWASGRACEHLMTDAPHSGLHWCSERNEESC